MATTTQRLENSAAPSRKKKVSARVGRPKIFIEAEEVNPRIYFELDDVITDLTKAVEFSGLDLDSFRLQPGMYLNVPPKKGALKSLEKLRDSGCDLWVTTRVLLKNPGAASEKIHWIKQYLPWLMRKVIITPEKGTLGTEHDYMIHHSKCDNFSGKKVAYGKNTAIPDWESLLAYLNDTLHLDLATDLRNGSTINQT